MRIIEPMRLRRKVPHTSPRRVITYIPSPTPTLKRYVVLRESYARATRLLDFSLAFDLRVDNTLLLLLTSILWSLELVSLPLAPDETMDSRSYF